MTNHIESCFFAPCYNNVVQVRERHRVLASNQNFALGDFALSDSNMAAKRTELSKLVTNVRAKTTNKKGTIHSVVS